MKDQGRRVIAVQWAIAHIQGKGQSQELPTFTTVDPACKARESEHFADVINGWPLMWLHIVISPAGGRINTILGSLRFVRLLLGIFSKAAFPLRCTSVLSKGSHAKEGEG